MCARSACENHEERDAQRICLRCARRGGRNAGPGKEEARLRRQSTLKTRGGAGIGQGTRWYRARGRGLDSKRDLRYTKYLPSRLRFSTETGAHFHAQAHISTQPPPPRQDSRISCAHEDQERGRGAEPPPRRGPQAGFSQRRTPRLGKLRPQSSRPERAELFAVPV